MEDRSMWPSKFDLVKELSFSERTIERKIAAGELPRELCNVPGRKPTSIIHPENAAKLKAETLEAIPAEKSEITRKPPQGDMMPLILVKVDRASVGVGLKVRIPLLDHRVVEFARRIALSMLIRDDRSKWLLRQVLYRYVPAPLVDRPKLGFFVPISSWLRGPMREWAEALLDTRRLRSDGYLNLQPIRQQWNEHLRGSRNWSRELWEVLVSQAWRETARRGV
jgi:asparagine synthase